MRSALQRIAAGWCVLMVLMLAGIQLANAGPGMPAPLWLVFSSVWIFGAAMIWWFPMFGSIGTALYGIILGANVLTMHPGRVASWSIAIGSFAATAIAITLLVQRRRDLK